jgi:hypothetical protein
LSLEKQPSKREHGADAIEKINIEDSERPSRVEEEGKA